MSIRKTYRAIKRLPERIKYRKPSDTFLRLGTEYGGWWVETKDFSSDSKIISAGLGRDVSFDLELIEKYGCRVIGLDPTPKSTDYVAQKTASVPNFEFQQVAIAKSDGVLHLSPPDNSKNVSFKLSGEEKGVAFPCKSLSTILTELNWGGIDLLKMDIEGAEFEVLQDLVEKNILVNQLCVEFHRDLAIEQNIVLKDFLAFIQKHGFRLVYKEYDNYTFLRST